MVQVDVFWSYALGATLATASARQLCARQRDAQEPRSATNAAPASPRAGNSVLGRWSNPYLAQALLFLALLFVPSGAYLVWAFPSWETMHVGSHEMPAWVVTLFTVTNFTQGLIGFLVVEWLLVRGRTYIAYLQILAGYVGMFFILVHGWDGTGYQRFFSPTRDAFVEWNGDWSAWLTSDVALSLYGMGVVLVPTLLFLVARWHVGGYTLEAAAEHAAPRPAGVGIAGLHLATVFIAALGLGIAAHLALVWMGSPIGAVAAVLVLGLALVPGGPVHRLFRAHGLPEHAARRSTGATRLWRPWSTSAARSQTS